MRTEIIAMHVAAAESPDLAALVSRGGVWRRGTRLGTRGLAGVAHEGCTTMGGGFLR